MAQAKSKTDLVAHKALTERAQSLKCERLPRLPFRRLRRVFSLGQYNRTFLLGHNTRALLLFSCANVALLITFRRATADTHERPEVSQNAPMLLGRSRLAREAFEVWRHEGKLWAFRGLGRTSGRTFARLRPGAPCARGWETVRDCRVVGPIAERLRKMTMFAVDGACRATISSARAIVVHEEDDDEEGFFRGELFELSGCDPGRGFVFAQPGSRWLHATIPPMTQFSAPAEQEQVALARALSTSDVTVIGGPECRLLVATVADAAIALCEDVEARDVLLFRTRRGRWSSAPGRALFFMGSGAITHAVTRTSDDALRFVPLR